MLGNILTLLFTILAKKNLFQKIILILAGMLTSKIVAFGAQKTCTYALKSRRTQNESLFCAARGKIGSFSFKIEQGEAVTVNGDRYQAMWNEFLFTKIIYSLKSTPNDRFEKLFMAILFTLRVFARNLLRGNRRRNSFRISF